MLSGLCNGLGYKQQRIALGRDRAQSGRTRDRRWSIKAAACG